MYKTGQTFRLNDETSGNHGEVYTIFEINEKYIVLKTKKHTIRIKISVFLALIGLAKWIRL
jgi:hypothetical protein